MDRWIIIIIILYSNKDMHIIFIHKTITIITITLIQYLIII